jgi:opacity protein-like surface antigen
MNTLKLMLIILMLPTVLLAQSVSRVGTTAAPFLKIGVGARALAMGEASVTQASDVSALFWNPGGLGTISKNQFILNHYDYIAELSFDFAGVALKLPGVGTIGLQFTYLGAPDLERTTLLQQDGTGEMVSTSFYSAGLSFARSLTDRFAIGGTFKLIQENLWHSKASGVSLDLGILYTTIFKNLKLGMSISNFGSSMKMSGRDLLVQHDIDPNAAGNNETINADMTTDEFPLPILFRVGMSANLARDFLEIENHDFIIAVDAIHPNDNKEYMNIGGEYSFHRFIALRAGYRQLFLDENEGGFTFGFGLHFNVSRFELNLDYAALDFGRFDYVNKFSFIFSF